MAENRLKKNLTYYATRDDKTADAFLISEYDNISQVIKKSELYIEIKEVLEILDIFVFRVSEQSCPDIIGLINRLDGKALELPDEYKDYTKYYNNSVIQVIAIKLLEKIRYHQPHSVSETLFELSLHSNESIQKAALEALKNLAEINLHVFQKIRVTPQLQLLEKIELFNEDEIKKNSKAIFASLHCFLTSNISSTSWDYKSAVFHSGAIPAGDDIHDLRRRTVNLIKGYYPLANTISWKLSVIGLFQDAMRTYSTTELSEGLKTIISENTLEILAVYKSLIHAEKLQIIQAIEHNSYWQYYHAINDEIALRALEIEEEIAKHEEYKIYRDLVGFQGIFGSWEENKKNNSREHSLSKNREKRSRDRAASVTKENFPIWQERILEYIKTESDDLATFPNLGDFLHELAIRQPKAFLKFLINEHEALSNFMVTICIGLWKSEVKDEIRDMQLSWIEEDMYLEQSAKLMSYLDEIDQKVFDSLYLKSLEKENKLTLNFLVGALFNRFSQNDGEVFNKYFIPIMTALTKLKSTDWLHEVWFRRDRKELINSMSDDDIDTILNNLLMVEKIDYHSDEILSVIENISPNKLLNYFGERLEMERRRGKKTETKYEAFPFEIHNFGEQMAENASQTVKIVRSWFDGNYGKFTYREASFLENIFTSFPKDFENELRKFITSNDEDDLLFVLGILRAYDGKEFIYPLCMEIIDTLPSDHELINEVKAALWSSGVLMGEFGHAESLERKIEHLSEWSNSESNKVRTFVREFSENLAEEAKADRGRAAEGIELRKIQYGNLDDE